MVQETLTIREITVCAIAAVSGKEMTVDMDVLFSFEIGVQHAFA